MPIAKLKTKIVVTAGIKPFAYGEKGKGVAQMPVVPVEQINDVTGAGDAFSAGLLYGLINGYSLQKAAEVGALNAALNIQSADSVRADLAEEMLLKVERTALCHLDRNASEVERSRI